MKIGDILDYKLKKVMSAEDFAKLADEDKNFALAQAKTVIQNYCHRVDIPYQLYYIWADMAIDVIRQLNPSLFSTEDEMDALGKVASVHDGDTTINFSTSNNDPDTLQEIANNLVTNWSTQLKSWRKVPRGCGSSIHGI